MTAPSRATTKTRASSLDPRAFIRANLPLAPAQCVPEIVLHRANASSGLWRLARESSDRFASPYWAYPWPGGLALARYILDEPRAVRGRNVLDLGAGSGLVGIAAAKAGARKVFAADIDPMALAALDVNATANGVHVSPLSVDLAAVPPAVDLVLIGDLFYAPALAERVMPFLELCQASGMAVLIGDPRRAFLPVSRLRAIADYEMPEVGGSAASATPSAVFQLLPRA